MQYMIISSICFAGIQDEALSGLIKCLCDTLFIYLDKASKSIVEGELHRLVDVYGM